MCLIFKCELLKFGGAHSTPLATGGLPGEGEDALIVGAREFNRGEGEGEEVQPVETFFTNFVPEPVDDVLDDATFVIDLSSSSTVPQFTLTLSSFLFLC